MARAPSRPHLGFDPRLELRGEHLSLQELHEQHHALVRPVRDALPHDEAVDDGVCRVRGGGRETVLDHVVYLS